VNLTSEQLVGAIINAASALIALAALGSVASEFADSLAISLVRKTLPRVFALTLPLSDGARHRTSSRRLTAQPPRSPVAAHG